MPSWWRAEPIKVGNLFCILDAFQLSSREELRANHGSRIGLYMMPRGGPHGKSKAVGGDKKPHRMIMRCPGKLDG